MHVYLVVVAGHNYSAAVFANAINAEAHAEVLNKTHRDDRGMWIVVEATAMDFYPGKNHMESRP